MSAPADGATRNIYGGDLLAAHADALLQLNLAVIYSTNKWIHHAAFSAHHELLHM